MVELDADRGRGPRREAQTEASKVNERATASDDVDELIARLAAEGEVAESGVFTIDPELAVEKLREFQLTDPVRFVLCWVRAAVLLGATRVDIAVEANDVRLRFDGAVLTPEELDVLWSSVMGIRKKARTRALREMALGTNGAFSWQAKAVTIQSGPTLVHVDRNFRMRREEVEPGPVANTLHAKRPIGWDLLRRRRLDRRGQLPEELLLVRASVDSRIPIYLEGLHINPPPVVTTKPWIQVEIEDEGRVIRYRIGPGMSSKLRVLLAGVEVCVRDLDLPPGVPRGLFEATVDDSLLPLDLSQEKPIEGQRWRELLDSVVWARWQAWFALAARERWPRAMTSPLHGAGQRALLEDVLAAADRSWMEVPGAMGWAERVELPLAVSDPHGGFRPLLGAEAAAAEPSSICEPWPRPEPEALRFAELLEHADGHGWIFCASSAHPELPYVPEVPVLLHGSSTKTLHGNDLIELTGPSSIGRYLREVTAVRELSGTRSLPEGWVRASSCDVCETGNRVHADRCRDDMRERATLHFEFLRGSVLDLISLESDPLFDGVAIETRPSWRTFASQRLRGSESSGSARADCGRANFAVVWHFRPVSGGSLRCVRSTFSCWRVLTGVLGLFAALVRSSIAR